MPGLIGTGLGKEPMGGGGMGHLVYPSPRTRCSSVLHRQPGQWQQGMRTQTLKTERGLAAAFLFFLFCQSTKATQQRKSRLFNKWCRNNWTSTGGETRTELHVLCPSKLQKRIVTLHTNSVTLRRKASVSGPAARLQRAVLKATVWGRRDGQTTLRCDS